MERPPTNRIPTLDGWRGIAVLFVLLYHWQQASGHLFLDIGQHGVMIFFVLSGFLVTKSLLRDDKVDLKKFYIKRFFRILPAAWVYLVVLYLLCTFGHFPIAHGELWSSAFFTRNYYVTSNLFTGQFWSLAVEEQFYLLWPLVLLVLRRRGSIVFAAVTASLIAFHRLHAHLMLVRTLTTLHTEVRADAILVGCLLAFLLENGWAQDWLKKYGTLVFWLCAPLVAVDVYSFQVIPPLHEAILVALMAGATMMNPTMLPSRVLELPYLKATGLLCYGIYLWQSLFLSYRWGPFAYILLPAFVFSSWFLIEEPSRKMGLRLLHKRGRMKPQGSLLAGKREPMVVKAT